MKRTVVITGPESSGKSDLSQSLAKHLNCPWVPEYARWYLEHLYREYKASDLDAIAYGQRQRYHEQRTKHPEHLIILDTWALVMTVWNKVRYGGEWGKYTDWLNSIEIDMYLLCRPDVSWQPDPLREHPNQRWLLFDLYEEALNYFSLPYAVVEGQGAERIEIAKKHLADAGIV